jgi:predicted anti-sigma-YlaC factor YlaD
MNCEMAQNILEEYLEEELDDTLRREVESHIQKCSYCQHELHLTEDIAQFIKMIPNPKVPRAILDNVAAEIYSSQPQITSGFSRIAGSFKRGIQHIGDRLSVRKWRVVTAIAMMLLVLGMFGGYYLSQKADIPQQPYITGTQVDSQQVAQAVEDIKFALSIIQTATKKTEVALAKLPAEMGIDVARQKAFNTLQEVDATTSEKVLDAIRRGLSILTNSESILEIQTNKS